MEDWSELLYTWYKDQNEHSALVELNIKYLVIPAHSYITEENVVMSLDFDISCIMLHCAFSYESFLQPPLFCYGKEAK